MTNTSETYETTNGVAVVSRVKHGHIRVVTLDWTVELVHRQRSSGRDNRAYDAKVRAYGALSAFVPGFDARETELVIAANRRDPNVKDPELARYQRQSIAAVRDAFQDYGVLTGLAEALQAAGYEVVLPEFDEWKFSIKAGCSMCPCSPGFIGSGRLLVDGRPVDIFFC